MRCISLCDQVVEAVYPMVAWQQVGGEQEVGGADTGPPPGRGGHLPAQQRGPEHGRRH